jgi:hypothetical protein
MVDCPPIEVSGQIKPLQSKKFIRIDKPVYGAIMVMRNYVKKTGKANGSGHITLVYGETEKGAIAGLGGNQGDSIKVSPYKKSGVSAEFSINGVTMQQKFFGFYIPATYAEYAKKEGALAVVDAMEVNKELLKITNATTAPNEGTR